MSTAHTAQLGPNTFLKGKMVQLKGSTKNVHAFLGIPYAQPPVGKLRFKRPEPVPLWTGTRDALEFGPICPQENGPLMKLMMGDFPFPHTDEDCLYLNVWTPTLNQDAKLPVMVWIHGGGWINGCSNYYNGITLAERQEVVFVSINYRLGIFGFLCLGDESAPGNMGLLDQVEALKWIKSNIKAFGGDPNNVTIFGESAGAMSVGFHTASKLSKGLFHKAIIESGSILHKMFLQSKEAGKATAITKLKSLGLEGSTSEEVIQWLEAQETSRIAQCSPGDYPAVLDGYFLQDLPEDLYQMGNYTKVPVIVGFNSHEGGLFRSLNPSEANVTSIEETRNQMKYGFSHRFYPGNKNAEKIFEAVWDCYVGNETNPDKISQRILDIQGDLMFVQPSIYMAETHSERAPTYLYNFTHRKSKSIHPEWIGASHTDEIDFVIGKPFYDEKQENWTDEERQLSDLCMAYWANFARTGNPNGGNLPDWPQYKKGSKELIHLKPTPEIKRDHNAEKMNLWNTTIQEILKGN